MVDRLMREWEVWSRTQTSDAAEQKSSTASASNTDAAAADAAADTADAATGDTCTALIEAAPPALTVRGNQN